MSEHYEFPDEEDVPTITTTDKNLFERNNKNLFIKYDPDEWEDPQDAARAINVINYLFGTEVQVTVMNDKIEFMSEEKVKGLSGMEIIVDGDDLEKDPQEKLVDELNMEEKYAEIFGSAIEDYLREKISQSSKDWPKEVEQRIINYLSTFYTEMSKELESRSKSISIRGPTGLLSLNGLLTIYFSPNFA